MKSVLRSVKPYYFYLICDGIKNIEVGKNMPKSDDWDNIVYLYCSKDKKSFNRIPEEYREKYRKYLGTVCAKFVCDRIVKIRYEYCDHPEIGYPVGYDCGDNWWEWDDEETNPCLSDDELNKYACGLKRLYGWHISDLKIYDKPRELGEFYRRLPDKVLEEGDYDCRKSEIGVCLDFLGGGSDACADCPFGGRIYLTRPPQSWQYIEEF